MLLELIIIHEWSWHFVKFRYFLPFCLFLWHCLRLSLCSFKWSIWCIVSFVKWPLWWFDCNARALLSGSRKPYTVSDLVWYNWSLTRICFYCAFDCAVINLSDYLGNAMNQVTQRFQWNMLYLRHVHHQELLEMSQHER